MDPHIHAEWELKFFSTTAPFLVPPNTIHPESRNTCLGALQCSDSALTFRWGSVFLFLNSPRPPDSLPILRLFELYHSAGENHEEFRRQLCRTILQAILEELTELLRNPQADARKSPFQQALDFMRGSYYCASLSVPEIAQQSRVSPQYLNRKFQEILGCGIRKALIQIRLQHARELLQTGRYLVAEVARMTGWRSPFYFSNSFKRQFHLSPELVARNGRQQGQ